MSQDTAPIVLLAPGLGGLRRLFEPTYRALDLPTSGLAEFLAGEGRSAGVLVTGGGRAVEPELAASPAFKLVTVFGSGFEGVDVEGLGAQGVSVTHTPNVNHEDVADHAVGLLIACVRKIVVGDRTVRSGDWFKRQHAPPTRSLRTLAVGVVGFGAIGEAVAHRVAAFGCRVAWWGPRDKPEVAYPKTKTLLELAEKSDALVICHRADASNKGLISREIIDALGPRGVLVNIARGSAVDEEALIDALKSGRLGGAGLDVFEVEPTPVERWQDVPNVILTPHTAGGGDASLRGMTSMVLENLRCFFAGEPLATPVPIKAEER